MADIEENAVLSVDTRDTIILALFGMAYRSYTLASHNFMCVASFPSLIHGNIKHQQFPLFSLSHSFCVHAGYFIEDSV